jgi:hypothetical protein
MTDKNVTVTVSISTNPQVAGRYFIDVRDTTHDPDPRTAHQMTTRTRDAGPAVGFIGDLTRAAHRQGVRVTVKDTTDELPL